jgi:hypothetical protein
LMPWAGGGTSEFSSSEESEAAAVTWRRIICSVHLPVSLRYSRGER